MTVNDAYWAHLTGTADCNQSCLTAWQQAAAGKPSIELRLGGRSPGLYIDGKRVS